ncbi:hypothetical protein [Thalassobellus suaedae]|uniref:Uncharacterized protein n=1 Tax=Thalassobellus suaedae TaxID=3074124 RepID=A0ABY9Y2U2_9FLAO|nr:hypothetical protein RHP49_16890 [Flavobacteriaceae bacterium HL-DH10]
MHYLIENDLLDKNDIYLLQQESYSKNIFDIQYPMLKKALPSDGNNILRYWSGPVLIKGSRYFICSEWYEQPNNNDRPFFEAWYRKKLKF